MSAPEAAPAYGVMAEFDDPDSLLGAARAARAEGFGVVEGFSPYPVEGLDEALGLKASPLPLVALGGALLGGLGFYALQAYAMGVHYRFDIGGRPLFSWPSYVLPSFAVAVMLASVAAVAVMLALCRLPKLHHPAFDNDRFGRASEDRFFLRLGPEDGRDAEAARRFLEGRNPLSIRVLP